MAQADIDTTIAALQQGLTAIPADQAAAVIDSWQQQLQGNPIAEKLGDLKAFWVDLNEMEKLFYCQDTACRKPVLVKHYDTVKKRIRCGRDIYRQTGH